MYNTQVDCTMDLRERVTIYVPWDDRKGFFVGGAETEKEVLFSKEFAIKNS